MFITSLTTCKTAMYKSLILLETTSHPIQNYCQFNIASPPKNPPSNNHVDSATFHNLHIMLCIYWDLLQKIHNLASKKKNYDSIDNKRLQPSKPEKKRWAKATLGEWLDYKWPLYIFSAHGWGIKDQWVYTKCPSIWKTKFHPACSRFPWLNHTEEHNSGYKWLHSNICYYRPSNELHKDCHHNPSDLLILPSFVERKTIIKSSRCTTTKHIFPEVQQCNWGS